MDKHAVWKWLILVALVMFSIWVVTPPKEKIRLGLDLKGGMSFTVRLDPDRLREELKSGPGNLTDEQVEVEVRKRLDGAQGRTLEVMRNRIDSLGIAEPDIRQIGEDRITIQLPGIDQDKRKEAEKSIRSLAFLEFRMLHDRNYELVEKLFADNLTPEGYRIVSVGNENFYERDLAVPAEKMDSEYRQKLGRFQVPSAAYEFMLEKEDRGGRKVYRPAFVKRRRDLSGEFLRDASVDYQGLGQPVVAIKFDAQGRRKFASITADYAPGGAKNPDPNGRRYLGIVLDGTLYSAPFLKVPIYDGAAIIEGNFSLPEATFLANILRAGSLPAPVKIIEERFVAPSLGEDSIRSGVRAVIVGAIGVVLFMMLYYRISGVIADLALGLNLIILPLGMIVTAGFLNVFSGETSSGGAIQLPVLTLPGIAGILLTIGMAVDANVLIFERMREESRPGISFATIIARAYDRAFLTIVDSNLTTLLTGIILFRFGSGPIRGFAVTLCAGIIVSMFTALVVTKLIFGLGVEKDGEQGRSGAKATFRRLAVKMSRLVGETKIDFIRYGKPAVAISVAVILVSLGVMTVRGLRNPGAIFGVDFTGGSAVTFTYNEKQPVAAVRDALRAASLNDTLIQYQEAVEAGESVSYLQVKTAADLGEGTKVSDVVRDTLVKAFPNSNFVLAQEDDVGPQIGKEMRGKALWAILLAMLGMIVYIAFRFKLGFAVGAIVAIFHDVLVTVGLYALFGRQLSLTIVAALLTIVGYSVNDTIVIFDRIREDLADSANRLSSFRDICNLSINQTLSRTFLTSLTTLITVGSLLVFGGGAVNDFALALFIGVIVGTYSTVYIATPVLLLFHPHDKPKFAPRTVK